MKEGQRLLLIIRPTSIWTSKTNINSSPCPCKRGISLFHHTACILTFPPRSCTIRCTRTLCTSCTHPSHRMLYMYPYFPPFTNYLACGQGRIASLCGFHDCNQPMITERERILNPPFHDNRFPLAGLDPFRGPW